MFTGIVTDIGQVAEILRENGARIALSVPFDVADVTLGASVSCAGVCLTVADKGKNTLTFEASEETLARTTLGSWDQGTHVNLERSLKAGDELGGHFVMGHVDAVGEVVAVGSLDGAIKLDFSLPSAISHLVAEKGSITVDGVSLTVNSVTKTGFSVAVIPHTAKITTLGNLRPKDKVNLEADVFARYSARLLEMRDS